MGSHCIASVYTTRWVHYTIISHHHNLHKKMTWLLNTLLPRKYNDLQFPLHLLFLLGHLPLYHMNFILLSPTQWTQWSDINLIFFIYSYIVECSQVRTLSFQHRGSQICWQGYPRQRCDRSPLPRPYSSSDVSS